MNFLGIFKNVVKDTGLAAPYVAFGVGFFNPPMAAVITRIGTAMVQVEAQIPDNNQGATKAALVTQDFAASMSLTSSLLAQSGKTMTWDAGKLKTAIDAQTASFNAYAALASSIKIADTVPPTKPAVG